MRYFFSIIATIAFLLGGCSDGDRAMLRQANAIMEEHPDSALSILQQIDRAGLSSRDLPYYALLMTQAQVKTDVPLDSDSLISLAYRNFEDDRRGDRGIRSNFYMGEVFFNQEKSREAMKHYLSAYEESKRLGNNYWRAKSTERIADLFFNAYNYSEAARYRKEAIEYFGKAQRIINQRYAIADLASTYNNDGKSQLALQILDSIMEDCQSSEVVNSHLINYIQQYRISAMIASGLIPESSEYLRKINTAPSTKRSKLDCAIFISDINRLLKKRESNDSILEKAWAFAQDQADSLHLLYARYLNFKDSDKLYPISPLMDSLLYYQESVIRNLIKESIVASQRDFYESISEQHKRTSRLYLIIIVLAGSIFFMATIFFWRFSHLKSKLHRQEIESKLDSIMTLKASTYKLEAEKKQLNLQIMDNMASITNLTSILDMKDSVVDQLKSEVNVLKQRADDSEQRLNDIKQNNLNNATAHLFREQWSTLNMLCDEYFELGDTEAGRNHILRKIEKELKKLSSKKSLARIEEEVDRYLDRIMSRLRQECGFLNEKDCIFIMLIYAGFSVRAICILTDIKYGSFYVKKSRLIKKISESNVSDRDEFIERFN